MVGLGKLNKTYTSGMPKIEYEKKLQLHFMI